MSKLPDISALTLPQLNELSAAITARKIELGATKRKEVLAKIKELASSEGFQIRELFGELTGKKPRNRSKPSGDPKASKYYDPATNTGWNGVGRPPKAFSTPEGKRDEPKLAKALNPSYEG